MKKLTILLVFVLISAFSCSVQAFSLKKGTIVLANEITFPGKFYTTELKSCSAIGTHVTLDNSRVRQEIETLIGFDWHTYHHAHSTSVNVRHKPITRPMKSLMTATHNAIGNNNQKNIDLAIEFLVEIAKTNTLYDSIGRLEVSEKPNCNDDWGTSKACWYHEYEFAREVFANYMIAAIWLKNEITNPQDVIIVHNYIDDMYTKFVKQDRFQDESGIYAFANGGIGRLLYASWTNDKELAALEFNQRFMEFEKHIFDDGYIDNNSFRGNKGQWYHSYGLNIILGYVYIAELWGVNIPTDLQAKLVKASKLVNLAITDEEKFYSRPYPNGRAKGQLPENDTLNMFGPAYTHPEALSIEALMQLVTGITMEYDAIYTSRRRDGIDLLIGFNANCIK
jgi:hypothetical protein